jgi:hypothetical protein
MLALLHPSLQRHDPLRRSLRHRNNSARRIPRNLTWENTSINHEQIIRAIDFRIQIYDRSSVIRTHGSRPDPVVGAASGR